jgi:hypothetical protein
MKNILNLKIFALFVITIRVATALADVTEIDIEERTQKALHLSEDQINRIAISEGMIATIITNPSKFNVKMDENLGQAFITLKSTIDQEEGLTVVTDSGSTQDFLVTSYSGEPAIVYLNEPKQEEMNSYMTLSLSPKDFYGVYHGFEVEGFQQRLLLQNETIEVGDILPYVQNVSVYESPFENLYVLELKNHSRKTVKITPESFSASGEVINWIFSPITDLKKNEETKIIISKGKI